MAEVTTGAELNSYQGVGELAEGSSGNALGTAEADFKPLEMWALKQFEVNKLNYEREEEDRKKLETMFSDPEINVPLDETYANQISGRLDKLKEMMVRQPQLYKDKKMYYEFMREYNSLLNDNAKLKTVQTAKDAYKTKIGVEKNPRRKQAMENYVQQLEGYSLGDDIPAYSDVFDFDSKHLPETLIGTTKKYRKNGNYMEEYDVKVYDPANAPEKAMRQLVTDPTAESSGVALAEGLLNFYGDIDWYNQQIADAYSKSENLVMSRLAARYNNEWVDYKKKNPNKTFADFIAETNKTEEKNKAMQPYAFLSKPIQLIETGGSEGALTGFTYTQDGKRLSVDNSTLRAIFSAINNPIGEVESLVKRDGDLTDEKAKTEQAKRGLYAANTNLAKEKTAKIRAETQQQTEEGNRYKGLIKQTVKNYVNTLDPNNLLAQLTFSKGGFRIPATEVLNASNLSIGEGAGGKKMKPFGTTKVYDKYRSDGKTPLTGAKVIGEEGGYYEVVMTNSGKKGNPLLTSGEIKDAWSAYLTTTSEPSVADFFDILSEEGISFSLKGSGSGDYITEDLNAAALLMIDNKQKTKGEESVTTQLDLE